MRRGRQDYELKVFGCKKMYHTLANLTFGGVEKNIWGCKKAYKWAPKK